MMSPHGRPVSLGAAPAKGRLKAELGALKRLAPYLWPRDCVDLQVRVVLAAIFLIAGKLANIFVPFLYKYAVNARSMRCRRRTVPRALSWSPLR